MKRNQDSEQSRCPSFSFKYLCKQKRYHLSSLERTPNELMALRSFVALMKEASEITRREWFNRAKQSGGIEMIPAKQMNPALICDDEDNDKYILYALETKTAIE